MQRAERTVFQEQETASAKAHTSLADSRNSKDFGDLKYGEGGEITGDEVPDVQGQIPQTLQAKMRTMTFTLNEMGAKGVF